MSSQGSFYLGEEACEPLVYETDTETSREYLRGAVAGERAAVVKEISWWCNSRLKRWFDLALTLPTVVLAAPLLAGVAAAIKLTSHGPVFFRQARVGRNRVPFVILKFRTMTHQADQSGPTVTRCGDPRLTRLGCFLRRTKLDELPQLFNVLWGEMSLVGPRPKLAHHEKMSMACRPGITGAATIVFCNEEQLLAGIPEPLVEQHALAVLNPLKVKLDQEYQRKASFATDMEILVKTLLGRRQNEMLLASAMLKFERSPSANLSEHANFESFPGSRRLHD